MEKYRQKLRQRFESCFDNYCKMLLKEKPADLIRKASMIYLFSYLAASIPETASEEEVINLLGVQNPLREAIADWVNQQDGNAQLAINISAMEEQIQLELLQTMPKKITYLNLDRVPPQIVGAKPMSIKFPDGNSFRVTSWNEVAAAVLKRCNQDPVMHQRLLESCDVIYSGQTPIISRDPKFLRRAHKIDDEIFMEGYSNACTLLSRIQLKILDPIGYSMKGIFVQVNMREPEKGLGQGFADYQKEAANAVSFADVLKQHDPEGESENEEIEEEQDYSMNIGL